MGSRVLVVLSHIAVATSAARGDTGRDVVIGPAVGVAEGFDVPHDFLRTPVISLGVALYTFESSTAVEPEPRRTLRSPSSKLVLEAAWFHALEALALRISGSKGIGPVNLGLGLGFIRFPANSLESASIDGVISPELSLHLTPIGDRRTPVFDLFIRIDVIHPPIPATMSIIGVRAALDLF